MKIIPLILIASFLLTACALGTRPAIEPKRPAPGGGYYMDDGPHAAHNVDIDRIPDAVPRHEPLSPGGNKSYVVFGKQYHPLKTASGYQERGVSSWYGKKFHGNKTSNGEIYDMYAMSAAHKTLPLPSYVRVTNLKNGRSVVVRVNDRGPFLHNRLIDLSYAAASKLDIVRTGTGLVEVGAVDIRGPRPPLAASDSTPPAGGEPRLYLQVGAFSQRNNADNVRDRLQRELAMPVKMQTGSGGGGTVYRVRLGPLKSVVEADQLAQRVATHGFPDAILIVE